MNRPRQIFALQIFTDLSARIRLTLELNRRKMLAIIFTALTLAAGTYGPEILHLLAN